MFYILPLIFLTSQFDGFYRYYSNNKRFVLDQIEKDPWHYEFILEGNKNRLPTGKNTIYRNVLRV